MALKVLMLRSKLKPLEEKMRELNETRDGFNARERELETAIAEATTDEERGVVEEAVEAFDQERSANDEEIEQVQGRIDDINEEIRSIEERQTPPETVEKQHERNEEERRTMDRNTERRWFGMTYAERDALMQQEEVRSFLGNVRALRGQTRAVNGQELGIPDGFLPILRDLTYQESKFLKYVSNTVFKGTTRQNIAGIAPEAIWTEMTGALNEIDLDFHQLTMDGYMVGGYMAVPNSMLMDDGDLQLATTVLQALASSLAKAIDKAIWFGTGSNMPVGILTRLAATSKPEWWGPNQGEFVSLKTSNVLKLNLESKTGVEFFTPLVSALATAKPNYSNGKLVWTMNRKTHMDLMSKAMAFDSSAALVSKMSNEMPIIGGEIVEWETMGDFEIAGGYMDLYRTVEREGTLIDSNTNVRWLQNQTCFKGLQRRDGKPAIGEAFVAVNYHNAEPSMTTEFGKDSANTALGALIVTTAAGASGKTIATIAGNGSGVLKYQIAGQPVSIERGETVGKTWNVLPSNKTVTATTGQTITVVEVDADGRPVAIGSGSVTAGA